MLPREVGALSLHRAMDRRFGSVAAHCLRTAILAASVAREIGWGQGAVYDLYVAASVHEAGTLCLPDAVVLKPTELTSQEQDIFRTHAGEGAELVFGWMTDQQCSWIRGHHERWDGSGYPEGKSAEDLEEGAWVLSVADAWEEHAHPWLPRHHGSRQDWDARRRLATEICRRGSGTLFRADLVGALERVLGR